MRAVVVLELDLPEVPNAFTPVMRGLARGNVPHVQQAHAGIKDVADRVLAVFDTPTEDEREGSE